VPTEPRNRVAAVVLAAGDARRFGAPKLLMPFGLSTVLGCVVDALDAAGANPIMVIAGSQAPALAQALAATKARLVPNPDPGRGMFSSVRVGVAALPEDIDRFLIALADQPRVQPREIAHLLRSHHASDKGIALPTHRGKRGHPVVFHKRYRDDILALADTHTLRDIIHSHPDDIAEIEVPSDSVLRDIDTPEQYRQELRRASHGDPTHDASTLTQSSTRGIFAEIVRLQRAGRRAVLAAPLWSRGSVPFRRHSKLLYRDDGSIRGTIGGGLLEAEVLEAAPSTLSQDNIRVVDFDLTAGDAAESGMICGGRCAVFLEPIAPDYCPEVFAAAARAEEAGETIVLITLLPPEGPSRKLALTAEGDLLGAADPALDQTLRDLARRSLSEGKPSHVEDPVPTHIDPLLPHPSLFIFGAGHISLSLAHMADLIGFRVVVIDDRGDFASPQRFPHADQVLVASVPDAFRQLAIDEDSYLVAVTRGHVMDEEVVAHALRTPARYIGMIGSKRKVAAVKDRLRNRDFSESDLARLHAPIGLDIGADTIEEIAVSILAQLIATRRSAA